MKKHLVLLLILLTAPSWCQIVILDKEIKEPSYSMKYPSSWKLDETGRNGAKFYLFKSPPSRFASNINLVIQNLEGTNLDLGSYTQISLNQIDAHGGKLFSSQTKSIQDVEFQEVIFEAASNGFQLKCLQYYFLKNDKAYLITFTAAPDQFDGLLEEVKKIMNTFTIQ